MLNWVTFLSRCGPLGTVADDSACRALQLSLHNLHCSWFYTGSENFHPSPSTSHSLFCPLNWFTTGLVALRKCARLK